MAYTGAKNHFFMHGMCGGYTEFRYGKPKKPVTLPKVFTDKKRRETIINGLMDELTDWRFSPFEKEAITRHTLRAALCMKGHSWAVSDAEAASLVHAAFMNIGVPRPSWDQGQLEYSDVNSLCAWCMKEIPDSLQGLKRLVRFCSVECAKTAFVIRDYASSQRENQIARSALALISTSKTTVRECSHCGDAFHPTTSQKKRMFCSIKCTAASKQTVMARPCQQCGGVFKPEGQKSRKFCSHDCYSASLGVASYQKHCRCCGFRYETRSKKSMYCGNSCKLRVVRNMLPAKVAPFVPAHAVTRFVVDGWFARAA
ncbi:hypothetical protein [uncultured Agrobacterium sp.]|uniref:hypothetical protein n=1 Tax=uncultured Agrobacterium sp. TaxID=157277 RepID=UPI002586F337|nr:hypothetical protein [uncultured Agrobacterium sp.]